MDGTTMSNSPSLQSKFELSPNLDPTYLENKKHQASAKIERRSIFDFEKRTSLVTSSSDKFQEKFDLNVEASKNMSSGDIITKRRTNTINGNIKRLSDEDMELALNIFNSDFDSKIKY